jgi:hypothetical protein
MSRALLIAIAAAAAAVVAGAAAVSVTEAYRTTTTSSTVGASTSRTTCGDIHVWDSSCTASFLGLVGFGADITDVVAQRDVTGSMLLELEESDFELLGISDRLDRKRWAAVLRELRDAVLTVSTDASESQTLQGPLLHAGNAHLP